MQIPLEILSSVDSTSSEAMRRLQNGGKAPFAIVADVQTAGRGRRGRQWLGDRGNLYVTVALPGDATPTPELATWPLRFAALVCEVLEQELGLTTSLKWPNDIYVDGAKLGGVLGESIVQGDDVTAIVIGLGLNIDHKPADPIEAEAVCLAELGYAKATSAQLCQLLLAAVAKSWTANREASLDCLWSRYGLLQGQLWGLPGEPPTPQLVSRSYDKDGGLELTRLGSDSGSPVRFVSADHDQRWLQDARHRQSLPFVTLDVGNTRAKLTRFDGSSLRAMILEPEAGDAVLPPMLADLPKGWPVYCISVNHALWQSSSARLERFGLCPIVVPKRPVRLKRGRYDFEQLGIDRLAAMEGALLHSESQSNGFVVISAGTAMTIDLIGTSGQHLGGYIMPGIAMGLTAMHDHTDQLPSVRLEGKLPFQTVDTRSAMLGGVRLALQGAAQLACAELRNQLDHSIEILTVATGGGSTVLFPESVDEHLIAHGIQAIVYR